MRVVKILSLIVVFATLFSSYGNATGGGGNTNKKTESSAKVDYTNFKCLKTLEVNKYGVESVAYSPDGKRIISNGLDNIDDSLVPTIKIWDANTGECLKTLKGHSDGVSSVSYLTAQK